MKEKKEERLQKYIASCGIASRRKAEELILNKKVTVNDQIVSTLGTKVNTQNDIVKVDGIQIYLQDVKVYIKLYKPVGYVTTVKDQFGRKCVMDLIDINERIYPIGRLDYDTSGLLLLTNDGELANMLIHPKYNIYKTYLANIKGKITTLNISQLENGILIDDYKTAPAKLKLLDSNINTSTVEISIYEGKNRQVRKMFEKVGYPVIKLKRITFGSITLNALKIGEWKYLSDEEIKFLKKQNN